MDTTTTSQCLEMAIELGRLGKYVFPAHSVTEDGACTCKEGVNCANKGKHPLWIKGSLENGYRGATNDLDIIRGWFTDYPWANLGFVPGMSGDVALDLDNKHGINGIETFAGYGISTKGAWAETTPSTGMHLVYKDTTGGQVKSWQLGKDGVWKYGPGVEVRGNTGYIIIAPSHNEKGEYHMLNWWTGQPAPMPEKLRQLLVGTDFSALSPEQAQEAPEPPDNSIPYAEVTSDALRASGEPVEPSGDHSVEETIDFWVQRALDGVSCGARDNTGLWLACQLRDAGVPEATIMGVTGYASGVPQNSKDPYTQSDWERNVRSAFSRSPRSPAKSAAKRNGNGHHSDEAGAVAEAIKGDSESAPDTVTVEVKPLNLDKPMVPVPNHRQLADRWIGKFPKTKWGQGDFRRYTEGYWPVVTTDQVKREIMVILEAAEKEGLKPNSGILESVTELARVKVSVDGDQWDACPDIIVCKNGTLHIPTMTLGAHNPDYYSTSRVEFDYDPRASDAIWEELVIGMLPEKTGQFLQEFAGLALTTETKYEIALWLYGPPGGGKSTVLEGFLAMLGKKACKLGLMDVEHGRFGLTQLPGKTLAVSTEQPAAYMKASDTLNSIISGERITVDRKYKDLVEITPRAKLAWAMNEMPRIPNADNGLFRRVKVVEFPAIPADDRNPEIKEHVKEAGAAILNWALKGLARLRARGRFDIPKEVERATQEFQKDNDIAALYIADMTEIGAKTGRGQWTKSSVLYGSYKQYCVENGYKAKSRKEIKKDLERLGLEYKDYKGYPSWEGISLPADQVNHFVS